MKPTDEYKEAVANATAFVHEHPDEKQVTGARIYHVNSNTVKSNLRRERKCGGMSTRQHGGQNKVLSEPQVTAIYKYVEDSYLSGYESNGIRSYWSFESEPDSSTKSAFLALVLDIHEGAS